MRVALVHNPPQSGSIMPMGAIALATVGRLHGVDVELVEFPAAADAAGTVRHLAGADAVGFSTLCSNYPRALLMVDELKRVSPATVCVFGGPQATTTAPATVRAFPSLNLIIRGEAETSWAVLLEELRGGRNWAAIPGAVWSANGAIFETPAAPLELDLDKLPMPLFEAYRPLARRTMAMIEVGRGCPYGCTFCSTNTFFKRRFRMKSPARIVAEMDRIHSLYGIRHFDFIHDMFTVRIDTVEAICDALKCRGFEWNCSCRTDRITPALLERMYDAGCRGLYFGIEAGSARMQRLVRKNLDIGEAIEISRVARAMGFSLTVSIILGYPQETRADLEASLMVGSEYMNGLADNVQLPLFSPLADTPIVGDPANYAFDGVPSNTVETDGPPTEAEAALIRGSFALFSAFYHPLGTEYARVDYLCLMTVLEQLRQFPATRRYVLEHDRGAFVSFLVRGRFGINPYGAPALALARDVLTAYGRTCGTDSVLTLLSFDDLCRGLKEAPIATRAQTRMSALAATVALASRAQVPATWAREPVELELIRSGVGITARLPATDTIVAL